MVTDMAKQTQASAVSAYKKASEELNTYYGQLDSYLKDQSEAGAIKAKDAMLKAANSYISKVDELIRKEEEALLIDQARMDEIDSSLQNEVSDSKIQNAIAKAKKVMKRSKADEIKLLKDFRVKLIKSRDRITSIEVGQGVSISEFGTAAKAAFDAFMKEAKDTLAEFEAKAEAEAAAIV
jgi:flagellar biosynthesis chaperone FliJ